MLKLKPWFRQIRKYYTWLFQPQLILFYFLFRNIVFQILIDHKIDGIKQKYNLEIHLGKAKIYGFRSIRLSDFEVISETGDTLLLADSIEFNPGVFRLLLGSIQLQSLSIKGLDARLNSNLLELWMNRHRKDTLISTEKLTSNGYSSALSQLETQLFVTIPGKIEITDASFRYRRENLFSVVKCEYFRYSKGVLRGHFLCRTMFPVSRSWSMADLIRASMTWGF